MADEPDEEIVLEAPETEGAEDEAPEDQEEPEGEEFSIEIDGEEAEEEPPLVKTLRQQIRDRDRELADHRKAAAPPIVVGDKPTLESCDWDEEKLETDLLAWHDRKRAAENQEADTAKAAEVRNQEFQRKALNYKAKLEALPLPAEQKEAAEKTVISALPELYQSAIVTYADDPAKVVVALARHPKKLEALAQETDPIKFILAMTALERNLKVVNRTRPPAAESDTVLRGSAPIAQGVDKEEQRLEKAANVSGDFSALFKYRRDKRKAA